MEPSGLVQACNRTHLPLPFTLFKAGLAGQGPIWTGAENPRPCRDVCVIMQLNFVLGFTVQIVVSNNTTNTIYLFVFGATAPRGSGPPHSRDF